MSVTAAEARVLELTAGEADPAFRRRAAWALSRLDLADGQRVLEKFQYGSATKKLPFTRWPSGPRR